MLALIGGSGLSSLDGFEPIKQNKINTIFGETSACLNIGKFAKKEIVFLPRHGNPHVVPPHKINYRANIWALKDLGVQKIIAVTAVGGITALLSPGTIVIPHQIIDYTYGRENTFFDGTIKSLEHIDFTQPYNSDLRTRLIEVARKEKIKIIDEGVYAATQGPRLETSAEILRLENDGADIVGMTGMPEASLAKEAGLAYAKISIVANWAAGKNDSEQKITVNDINSVVQGSIAKIKKIISSYLNEENGG